MCFHYNRYMTIFPNNFTETFFITVNPKITLPQKPVYLPLQPGNTNNHDRNRNPQHTNSNP